LLTRALDAHNVAGASHQRWSRLSWCRLHGRATRSSGAWTLATYLWGNSTIRGSPRKKRSGEEHQDIGLGRESVYRCGFELLAMGKRLGHLWVPVGVSVAVSDRAM